MRALLPVDGQMSEHPASVRVRSVELKATDSVQTYQEKLAKIILEDMYQFVALLDAQGRLLEVNRAALEGAGIRLEDIQGKPFWEARWWQVSEEIANHQREACQRAARGEFIRYDVEVYGRARGEETIIIDYSLIPVRDSDGRVVFLLPEGRNITAKKQAEAEIARKNHELQVLFERIKELDELKSQFFANVSHELRTPLALILGPAEKILEEGDYLRDTHRRDLEVIRRNASTLLKHVNDLLDISKLDAGKMATSYVEVDLARLLRVVAGHFDALAPQRGIRYVVDTPEVLRAQVDPDKIERVVLNLLSNAFKFTPAGGRIKLSLKTSSHGSRALISVQDSGPGVKEELRSLIFERFRQAEGGSTRPFGGTGLGLSIARDFVSLHGGVIGITDAPGGGALFQVEIPCEAPQGAHVRRWVPDPESGSLPGPVLKGALEELRPAARETNAGGPSPAASGLPRVLVVEDNPDMSRFIVEHLSDDFQVFAAMNGEEGLRRAQELDPALIITDIMMPGMSGDQMVGRIREQSRFDYTPVLVLSARADEALRARLLADGAQDYVMKPFSAQELLSRARNLVAMKQAQEKLRLLSEQLEARSNEQAARLAESETRFRLMIEGIKDYAIFMLDPTGHVVSWNAGAQRLTGYTEAEAIGKHLSCFHTREDLERGHPDLELARARAEGRYEEAGLRVRKDGSTYWAQILLSRIDDESGRIIGFAIITRDNTDQLRIQEALKASEAKFRTIADAMPQMVWSTLPDGYHDYYNQRWYEFTGVPVGSTDGEAWNGMFHSDDQARAWKVWRHSLTTGEPYEIEYRLRHRSGEYRWALGRALPVRDEYGTIIRWMGTCTDIHDHKTREEDLRQAIQARNEFISIASHELKTPVTSMSMQVEMVGRSLKRTGHSAVDPVKLEKMLSVSERQLTRLTYLIEEMLDVSRVATGRLAMEVQEADLGKLVEDVIERLLPQFQSAGSPVTCRIEAGVVGLWDPFRLEQVVQNLLSNALKYAAGSPVEVTVSRNGAVARLQVRDHGIGIPKELQSKIFERFERAIPASNISGLGLGLYIVREILKMHGGSIRVESEPGQGATFTVDLPLEPGKTTDGGLAA